MNKFNTNYQRRRAHTGLECKDPTMAQQHFEKECNINSIMKKYRQTGVLQSPGSDRVQPRYGDFTTGTDYREMMVS